MACSPNHASNDDVIASLIGVDRSTMSVSYRRWARRQSSFPTSAKERSEASSIARLTPTPRGGMTWAASPISVSPSRCGHASGNGIDEMGRTAATWSLSEMSACRDGAQPSETDKRISLISLTAEADKRLEPGRAALRCLDKEICSILTVKERTAVTNLLRRLVSHADGSSD